ncbi:glucan biosynthesis protein [Methyloligella sp. 2.7D]|uniref:glucan biosynthesis protein n=1 Tax=unclassified Methyloligella TaxID=2625955 RepID=UPI00157D05BD|nr:glucan biosynthesis protein [Methyloligella sp. GL2]QKP77140.1 glucan biosynthesis protein [Methyloligella sp. GL2]
MALGAAALGAAGAGQKGLISTAAAQEAPAKNNNSHFSRRTVVDLAKDMAKKPFQAPAQIPASFSSLSYDDYRKIRFRKDKALWADKDLGFTVELLHTGFVVRTPVQIYTVENGIAQPVIYSSELFDFGDLDVRAPDGTALFSGIRINAPINVLHQYDEVMVFQGASYFRGLGANQNYGISARGLAIDTGEPTGEEFPFFRSFWIETPRADSKTITVHALLDSPSVTGAFTFVIRPGATTVSDVTASLFARTDITHLGLAPLTSMYFFDARERGRFDDFRPAVHDSDTLAIARGNDEWIMRPLANPKTLQISAFAEDAPIGFGLQQRETDYETYKDLESRFELRPSAWVQPKSPWRNGHVELVEIPTNSETNDNIVAFWRPRATLKAGGNLTYSYWLSFGPPVTNIRLARVLETRIGMASTRKRRKFVVEFDAPLEDGVPVYLGSDVEPRVSASAGRIDNVVGRHNPMTGGYQVSFEMDPADVELSELRLVLAHKGQPISETWLYRWTA